MNPETLESINAARTTVTQLLSACRKLGPLYAQNPRLVAQANRTGKWFLNALAALERNLNTTSFKEIAQ